MKKYIILSCFIISSFSQTLLASNITTLAMQEQQKKRLLNNQINETALEQKIRAQHSLREKKLEYEKKLTRKLKKKK